MGIDGTCGANKKNSSDIGGIDKLSDDVLINILSHMSLKEAARASVLAHRWRYLWRFTHGTLRFDHRNTATGNLMKRKRFMSWVNTVLELHQGRYIEGMVINFNARGHRSLINCNTLCAINSWVYFAMRKEVQRFEVNLSFDGKYSFPSVDMLVSRSHGVGSPFCRLRTLRLAHVDIKDEVVHYFLATCPNLEELCIQFSIHILNLQVIDPPSLRVLEINRCPKIQSLEISAVKLVSLTYGGGKNSLLLKNIPNIRELTISDDFCLSFVLEPKEHWSYSVQLEKLVLDFQLLNSSRIFVASPDLPQLYSLKRLEVQVYTDPGQSLLFFTTLIKASPQLCEFRIEMSYSTPPRSVDNGRISFYGIKAKVKVVRLRLAPRKLKVVEMGGYIGCSSEAQLLRELFQIGPLIERVVIDTKSDYFDKSQFENYISFRREFITTYGHSRGLPEVGATTRNEAKERAKHLVSKFPHHVKFIVT